MDHLRWHAQSVAETTQHFAVDPSLGLQSTEAAARLATYGANVLQSSSGPSAIRRFAQQFANPLVVVLLIASALTILVGGLADASVIIGVVVINAIIGFIQEGKAVQALAALSATVGTECTVRRDGTTVRMSAKELVPGDVVLLEAGDKVPADLRLIRVKDLAIAEAALTGESVPAEKSTAALAADTALGDRTCMAYASTVVTYGAATGIVVATGTQTEVGAISTLLADTQSLVTPLTRTIERFSRVLLWAILGLAAITFAIGLVRGGEVKEMLVASVALAVGAIPEGLPAAVTIILAIGVARMAKRRAIIRALSAVETLGSTTVICSDKTGTLTQNQMTVVHVLTPDGRYDVTGSGYTPDGSLLKGNHQMHLAGDQALEETIRCSVLCGTADVRLDDAGLWTVLGDPTEAALVVLGRKAGLHRTTEEELRPTIDVIPFSSDDQYMATRHRENGINRIYLKGSVEAILARCNTALRADGTLDEVRHDAIHREVRTLSEQGLRVLAMATKSVSNHAATLTRDDVAEMVFTGLVAMVDPPREEARQAIALCGQAGVRAVMITGDHASTAATIASQLGIDGERVGDRLRACTGMELATMNSDQFATVARNVSVFARVTPEQKLRLVESLQQQGNVVAMTGDGVNDAPALKQADIGVAMGRTGTDVAKDASDMVLTDDNFATIVHAVEEGRTVFDNLLKFIVWTIPTNIGEGLVIVVAIALGMELPIEPVQILWINMTTAIILGLPLAFEPNQPDVMTRQPRDSKAPILGRDLLMRTLFVGLLLLGLSFALFQYELAHGTSLEAARTSAANAFVLMGIFYLFACRTLGIPKQPIGWFSNAWVWGGAGLMLALQVMFAHVPFMNWAFKTAPVSLESWALAVGAGVVVLILVTLEKHIRARVTLRK